MQTSFPLYYIIQDVHQLAHYYILSRYRLISSRVPWSLLLAAISLCCCSCSQWRMIYGVLESLGVYNNILSHRAFLNFLPNTVVSSVVVSAL